MDNLIEFLITIVLVALFTIPSWLKKKDAARPVSPIPEPNYDDESDEYGEPFLQDFEKDIPKSEEYFTYETIGDNPEYEYKIEEPTPPEVKMQQTDNKSEGNNLLSLDKDEVLKGIIYSEILKRKF